ncbi:Glutamate--tRNA ligase [Methyloligella halotolerans]|uniref:Glutamate--tRNA ligase n=1 Tax=Methyloligella halotolerans TaxID=1177755 RepID=A0A1E2RWN9_9HYPH|nr:glutamate--tRNA ligase [Methyloligella halotolerans]ODA66550.1 Glutamate--tRNA ligase [Methyloligella halotolerans]
MTVTVRFAPSPTGRLHVGNIRTALFNWLFARKQGGRFLLRLDDTDLARSTAEFAQGIEEDLRWIGLEWDEFARQSDRLEHYDRVVEELKASGRLYPAYDTPEELELKRKRQRAQGRPPVYDRTALKLSEDERAALEAEGRKPHWRFKLEERVVVWDDLVRGTQEIDAASLSDPVLVREDGSYLYTLPSVVDDVDFEITDVIRGEDHVANTAAQIQIFEALGETPPRFGHHNLLVGADGEALSKRLGSLSIQGLREDGLEPAAVASYATLIGSAEAVAPYESLDALAEVFSLARISRAPARFDPAELRNLNATLLHGLTYKDVEERLQALGVSGGKPFWKTVRGNIGVLAEAAEWWRIVSEPIDPEIADEALCATAAKLLPDEPWDEDVLGEWLDAVKKETGAKGKALFMPIRLALTGRDHGPELKPLLMLIGKERAAARLNGERA